MKCGWGQVVGTGSGNLTDTITFSEAFSTEVISVTVTLNGYGTASPGSSLNAATGDWGPKSASATAHNITTSGCRIELGQSVNTFTAGTYFYYSWVAYGR